MSTTHTFCATELPWPGRWDLFSVFEMLEIGAKPFVAVFQWIQEFDTGLGERIRKNGRDAVPSEAQRGSFTNGLLRFKERMAELGLEFSTKHLERLCSSIESGAQFGKIHDGFGELKRRIQDELGSMKMAWVESKMQNYFVQIGPIFGEAVHKAFPSARIDIFEAGKCFALSRNTATVMHCMRVLEHGLRAMCLTLDLPFGEGTWKRSIQAIEKKILVLDSQAKQKAAWKKKRQFYAEAAAEFTYFKDAWRNHAAHGHDFYDETRADKILTHVRYFMQHLATRMSEAKRR